MFFEAEQKGASLSCEDHAKIGISYRNLRNMDKAITHLKIALESDANQPLWYYNLGRALDKKGHSMEAELTYKKSLLLDPSNGNCYNSLGNLQSSMSKFQEALKSF